jgi:hypothetical protein
MESLFIALCLVLILEGLGPLLMPNKWRAFMREVSQQPTETLRRLGGVMVVCGAITLYFLLA